jgi:hypothetical protein
MKCQEILDPFLIIGGKTNRTSYLVDMHLESFCWILLKFTNHRTNRKGEHSVKWNFPHWTQNYLPDWHATIASITQVVPVRSEQPLKSQIIARMISFGSLLASPFFIFPFRGRLRENYFLLQRGLFSRQLIRITALCCGWCGKCFSFNWHNQEVVLWSIVMSRSYRSLVRTLAIANSFCNISWPIVGNKQFRYRYSGRSF